MTRKDYILIAEAFQEQKKLMAQFPMYHAKHQQAVDDQMSALARNIAGALKRDNPSFDRPRFLSACDYPAFGYGYDKSVEVEA
jgi:hypothetical protein